MIVYVNAEEKRVISKKEYEFLLAEAIREADNSPNFYFWLERSDYTIEEVWELTDHVKYLIRQVEFMDFLKATYEESFAKSWVPMEYDAMEEDS